jgi:regulator of cell morphogenesis and NO signaling
LGGKVEGEGIKGEKVRDKWAVFFDKFDPMPDSSTYFPQVMQRYEAYPPLQGVNQDFLLTLLKAFEDKTFCASDFEPFPLALILDYIRKTHIYYLHKKLPEIEQSICLLSGLYNAQHPILWSLQNFFQQYCADLTHHIDLEETLLLPHIDLLDKYVDSTRDASAYILSMDKYSIAGFVEAHEDTEDELRDIRQTIGMYAPPSVNASLYRILLSQLHNFEKDLCVHAHIEDEVLIPRALEMERRVQERLVGQSRRN